MLSGNSGEANMPWPSDLLTDQFLQGSRNL